MANAFILSETFTSLVGMAQVAPHIVQPRRRGHVVVSFSAVASRHVTFVVPVCCLELIVLVIGVGPAGGLRLC